MKLIFAVLYVSLNDGPYTAVFYIYIFYICTSVHSWNTNDSIVENKRLSCWNSTSNFNLHIISAACDFASATATYHNHEKATFHSIRITHSGVMTSYGLFKLTATASQTYFRFPVCWRLRFMKIQNYFHSKFRQDVAIRGFWKHRAAILKFSYFRFVSFSSSDSATAYQILCELDDQRQSYDVSNLLPVSGFVTSHIIEGK